MVGNVGASLPIQNAITPKVKGAQKPDPAAEEQGVEATQGDAYLGITAAPQSFDEVVKKELGSKEKEASQEALPQGVNVALNSAATPLMFTPGYGPQAAQLKAAEKNQAQQTEAQKVAAQTQAQAGAKTQAALTGQTLKNSLNQLDQRAKKFDPAAGAVFGAHTLGREASGPQSVGQGGLRAHEQAKEIKAQGDMNKVISELKTAMAGLGMAEEAKPNAPAAIVGESGAQGQDRQLRELSDESLASLINEMEGKPLTKQTAKLNHQLSGSEFVSTLGEAKKSGKQALKSENLQEGLRGILSRDPGRGDSITLAQPDSSFNMQSALNPAVVGQAVSRSQNNNPPPKVNVTGHVVLGSMANERFSREALQNMGQGIGSLSQQGGGEMNIRLKPDSLGEMSLKVTTMGNRVGLKIMTADPRAQKVLEESMGALREQLASQNLMLSKVDILSGPLSAQSSGQSDSQRNSSGSSDNHHQQVIDLAHQRNANYQNSQQGSRSWVGDTDGPPQAGMRRSNAVAANAAAQAPRGQSYINSEGQSRIDLMA